MTAAAAPSLAILVWLGVWQLDRLHDKEAALADYAALAALPPVTLAAALCESETPTAAPVAAPTPSPTGEARLFGQNADGVAGWRVVAATARPSCAGAPASTELLVFETGFEPLRGARQPGPVRLRLEPPPQPGLFTPQNGAEEFYRFDRADLARALGVSPDRISTDLWLSSADKPPPALSATPPERHLAYALTWFGLAATLIGVYLAYHWRAGRLGRARA